MPLFKLIAAIAESSSWRRFWDSALDRGVAKGHLFNAIFILRTLLAPRSKMVCATTRLSAILNMPVKYIPMVGGLLILKEVSADSIFLQFKYLVACPSGVNVRSNCSIIIVHYKK